MITTESINRTEIIIESKDSCPAGKRDKNGDCDNNGKKDKSMDSCAMK